MNIVIGGIIQESNTFSEARPGLRDFQQHYFRIGNELLEPQSAENELAGFLRAAAEEGSEVNLLPTLFTQAVSSGKVPRGTLNELKRLLLAQLEQIPACDGILFSLHGAWVAEDADDADGEIVEAIRSRVGPDVPIVITLDSHANVTRKIAEAVDGIAGYRTFPHIDYAETGYRAAKMLFRIVRGESKPHLAMRKVPMIVPAERHETYRGPMAELWAEARKGEQSGHSALTSLFLVQPWLDIAEMGCTVTVMHEDARTAEQEADRLASLMWEKRSRFDIRLYSVEEAVLLAADMDRNEPVIVSDSADSPGAGSAGDSNYVLRELLRLGADQRFRCLLSIVDPRAARAAVEAGEGSAVKLRVGYSFSRSYGEPMEIEGTVFRIGSGKFKFGGGAAANLEANMGQCAVVKIGTIFLLVMENPTFTGDPAMYRSVGLEPAEADLVLVKSANQFRAEYEKLSKRIYILDTPGASTANLRSLPFRRIPRPMYPFDEEMSYTLKGDAFA